MSGAEPLGLFLARVSSDQSCDPLRIRGSHRIYAKAESDIRISVPVHGAVPLKRGLQRHMMKVGGIDEADL